MNQITYSIIKEIVDTALQRRPPDLILRNCRLVNVYAEQVYDSDILISSQRIAVLTPVGAMQGQNVLDCQGYFALPGFMDGHIHLESSALGPAEIARIIVPRGMTSVFADPHEIANVLGVEGIRLLLDMIKGLPLRLFLCVPSHVPAAPDLETSGASLELSEITEMLGWEDTVSLGELDPSKVLSLSEKYIAEVIAALKASKVVNGHTAGLKGLDLNAYIAAGILDDHNSLNIAAYLERLRLGMKAMVREGRGAYTLTEVIQGILRERLPTRHAFFCVDDKHANDLVDEGHIDHCIRRAIALGIDPIAAIQMGSLNCAERYRVDHLVGSITPGRLADIVLCRDLNDIHAEVVIVDGSVVARDGELLEKPTVATYPAWALDTINLPRPCQPTDFAIRCSKAEETVKVRVMAKEPISNMSKIAIEELKVGNGFVLPDPQRDILKIAVVERYKRTGRVGLGFISGFGFRNGAIASSVCHDHHNIVVIGSSDTDMAICVNTIAEMKGGFAVVKDGQVTAKVPLPLAGLMSDQPYEVLVQQMEALNRAAAELDGAPRAPFMSLSFVSLPSVPELGLSDRGLIDVRSQRLIGLFPDAP
ncbi:MAG: adenine deaminase [Chloroflexi bacterium]|nr:adenine deaminase [Chloroflexota bacterium]MCL5074341.1 adenine deaminase [Chloroflexota bacterium]